MIEIILSILLIILFIYVMILRRRINFLGEKMILVLDKFKETDKCFLKVISSSSGILDIIKDIKDNEEKIMKILEKL